MITNRIVLLAVQLCFAVESDHGRNAVTSDNGRAVGAYQIWPITVHETRRLVGRDLWTLEDRHNPQKSRAMCAVILHHHYNRGVRDVVQLAARWRNPKGNAPAWHIRKLETRARVRH